MAKMLSELFERCNDTQYADCMAGEVRSLAVSHDHRQMVCHVAYDTPMPRAALDGLGKEIANLYGLTRFSIAPRYHAFSPQYIQQLRLDLCHRMPSAAGLLAESQWELSADNHLPFPWERLHAVIFRSLCGRCRSKLQQKPVVR